MFDMMGNMEEQQRQLHEQLNDMIIEKQAEGGALTIKMNGNKRILDISINSEIVNAEGKEQLEDLLLVTFNAAIEDADSMAENEVQKQMNDILPGGLSQLFGS